MSFRWLFLFLVFSFSLFANDIAFWQLKGHLDKEALDERLQELKDFEKNPPKNLGIVVNSTSGDLQELLKLSKNLLAFKEKYGTTFSVYIDENALGPSALLPFLADEIMVSFFVSWGDIPLSSENVLPTNILRNQVLGLINPRAANRQILILLASAMTDPQITVVDDKGWKIRSDETQENRINVEGQTLVINRNQMQELGLIQKPILLSEFQKRYLREEQVEQTTVSIPSSQFDQVLAKHIIFTHEGKNRIGKIIVDDRTSGISQATWIYIRNALEYYKKNPPIFIILELNTPGGEVFAAQKISDALKDFDTQFNIPIVTFINNWAISAGAMLAYSTRFITVVKDASMGAAEPIVQDTSGSTQTASEKVNSAIRTDFANRAKFFGRNPYIAEAMVDKDILLVLRHGKVMKLDSESQIRRTSPDPDFVISPKGKLLTLNAEEMIQYDVANLLLEPKQLQVISADEKEKGAWPFKKELLSEYAFFNNIPNAEVDAYQMDWKTQFFSFLANPIVQSALFLGLLLGFYLEINTPGFGFPGSLALTCLSLILFSSFSQELASWLEVILLLSGLALILIDLLVIPTFGILGFAGIALFLIGLFSLMLPGIGSVNFEYDTQTFNAAGEAFLTRLSWLSATFILGLGIIFFLARYVMPTFGGFRRFVLQGHEQDSSQGYVAGFLEYPKSEEKGIALTNLRPAGKVIINRTIYDAVSSGKYIDRNASIKVERIDSSTVIVSEVKE